MGSRSYLNFIDTASQEATPVSAALELTYGCNLDCVHCYQVNHSAHPEELSTAEWTDVLENLADMGCLFLTITGGEPLTRPDALRLCRTARRLGFAVRLFTNGTLISNTIAGELAALDLLAVEISLYGDSAAIHDRVSRRPGSFDRSTTAAKLLVRAGAPVILKSPVMSANAAHLDGLRNLSESIGAALRVDLDMVPCDNGACDPLKLRLSDDELDSVLALDWVRERFVGLPPERPDKASDLCGAARRTCAVSSVGDVYPCIQLPVSAGNLRERTFEQIWRESDLMLKHRAMRVGDLSPQCGGCSRLSYCGRCGALALMEDGDFLGVSSWACRVAAAKERAAGGAVVVNNAVR